MSKQKRNRYPGVQPFRTEQADIFHGRAEDTLRLFSLIGRERLTVLYGKSGYGKSSLIQAGLLPHLSRTSEKKRRKFLPVVIRFNAFLSGGDLFEKYTFHRDKVLAEQDIGLLEIGLPPLPDTLWGNWKQFDLPEGTTVLLIFDQFEEFFTYPQEQQNHFKEQLAELLYSDYPRFLEDLEIELSPAVNEHLSEKLEVKALFAIRSDRMSELDQLKDRLPAILHKRMELGALPLQQARHAIVKPALIGAGLSEADNPFSSVAFEYRDAAVEQLLRTLQASVGGPAKGVEAFLLQVFCNAIESKVIAGKIPDRDNNGLPDVEISDLPPASQVLDQYYARQIAALPADQREVASEIIEEALVRTDAEGVGRRLSVDGLALLQSYRENGLDQNLLDLLVTMYLLRREPNSTGGMSYELSHDTLLQPVLKLRKVREAERLEEELELEKWKRWRTRAIGIVIGGLALVAILAFIVINSQQFTLNQQDQDILAQYNKLKQETSEKEKAFQALQENEERLEASNVELREQTAKAEEETRKAEENLRRAKAAEELAKQRAVRAEALAATLSEEDAIDFLLGRGQVFFTKRAWRDALTYWSAARFLAPANGERAALATRRVAAVERAIRGQALIDGGELNRARDTFELVVKEVEDAGLGLEIVSKLEILIARLEATMHAWNYAIGRRPLDSITELRLGPIPEDESRKIIQTGLASRFPGIHFIPLELLKMRNLQSLEIIGNESLDELPDFLRAHVGLVRITIKDNPYLGSINTLPTSGNLRFLSVRNNERLFSLSDLREAENLDTLVVADNQGLTILPDMPTASPLQLVIIANNPELDAVPYNLFTHPTMKSASIIANPMITTRNFPMTLRGKCRLKRLIFAGNNLSEVPDWFYNSGIEELFLACEYEGTYYDSP